MPTAVAVSVPLWAIEPEYFCSDDGALIGRAVNGVRQNFVYDKRGQLPSVKDARSNDVGRDVHDSAGNILSKTIGGVAAQDTCDAGSHDDTWGIVKIYNVTGKRHIHGTCRTGYWSAEE